MRPVQPTELLDFWFKRDRKDWFAKNPAFDAEIRARFLPLYERAMQAELDHWREEPSSCLAQVLLLDQFPRNMFRGAARAFAADALARAAARVIVEQRWDKAMTPDERMFADLPKWAEAHLVIIRRFGRFPHRNAALGRPSTREELEFLKQPGSSF